MSNNLIIKNNANANRTTAQRTTAIKSTLSSKQFKTPKATRPTTSGQSNNTNLNNLASKSKYTEKKPLLPPTTATTRARNLQSNNNIPTTTTTTAATNKVIANVTTSAQKNTLKIWNRKETPKDLKLLNTKSNEILEEPQILVEAGIQTNESEILNHDLLIGDIKFILPSKNLVEDIEREREEAKKKAMVKMQRKFEEHSEKQEEHLTDLQEFLDKAVITKRTRKPKEAVTVDKKLINSMDDIFRREMPRAESITDIKGRIKRKEKELLSLFDTVENVQNLSNTN